MVGRLTASTSCHRRIQSSRVSNITSRTITTVAGRLPGRWGSDEADHPRTPPATSSARKRFRLVLPLTGRRRRSLTASWGTPVPTSAPTGAAPTDTASTITACERGATTSKSSRRPSSPTTANSTLTSTLPPASNSSAPTSTVAGWGVAHAAPRAGRPGCDISTVWGLDATTRSCVKAPWCSMMPDIERRTSRRWWGPGL